MDEGESDCSPGRVITLRAETGYRTPFILLLSSLSPSLPLFYRCVFRGSSRWDLSSFRLSLSEFTDAQRG